MDILKILLKRQPEYAVLADIEGNTLAQIKGTKSSVGFDWPTVKNLRPTVFYHNHPYGYGVNTSAFDDLAITGYTMTFNGLYVVMTDFIVVNAFMSWFGLNDEITRTPIVSVSATPYLKWGAPWFDLKTFWQKEVLKV